MIKVDWDKAPKGATHLQPARTKNNRPVFWRVEGGKARECWAMDRDLINVRDHFTYGPDGCAAYSAELSIPRPWSGIGPIHTGTVVEFNSNWAHKAGGTSWHKVTVVYMSDENYVVRRDQVAEGETAEISGPVTPFEMDRFRPFRTPEQIAADELQRAVQQIMVDAGITDSALKDDPEAWVWAQALYEAGYRKQVAP